MSITTYKIEDNKINSSNSHLRLFNPSNTTSNEYLFKKNLPLGEHLVLASTTTIPETDDMVGGHAIYTFRLIIT